MKPLRPFFAFPIFLLLIGFLSPGILRGLPEGTEVIQGQGANFRTEGKVMTLTAPDGSIFRHQKFDVGTAETVIFDQPHSGARVLNRISGGSPSVIEGSLKANGQLYLVNPSGVVFGKGAMVEAGRLHVSAGSLSDEDFNQGRDRFTGLTGEITNEGKLQAEAISLTGSSVRNLGEIKASGGFVVVSAGRDSEFVDRKSGLDLQVSQYTETESSSLASDQVGRVLLETGIIEASEIMVGAGEIQADGRLSADSVRLAPVTRAFQNSSASVISSPALELTVQSESSPAVELTSRANSIGTARARGNFERLAISNLGNLTVESLDSSPTSGPSTVQANHLDLRSYEGDLTVRDPIVPSSSTVDSTLLLAARNSVTLGQPTSTYSHLRRVVYGMSFNQSSATTSSTSSEGFVTLRASSIQIEALSGNLSPEVVFSLALGNPSFAELQASETLQLEGLGDTQLAVLIKYGYLSGYSYFLQSFQLSPSALFGGDYAIFAKPDSELFEEEDDSESFFALENPGYYENIAATIGFSPIAMPVIPQEASSRLDRALDRRTEALLTPYLTK